MIMTDKRSADEKIKKVLFSAEELHEQIRLAGKKISEEYEGKPLLIVGVLTGSFVFMADLVREISIPCEMTFMEAKSYEGTNSTGNVKITKDIPHDITKYHVILVEDIIDTGRTLKAVTEILKKRGALSLKVVTLLDKPERRVVDFSADMSLFTIPDLFVIGYGLDFNEHYRSLPYIAEYDA